ncbi:hypothetical protein C8J57DRAFT_1482121 [Mycena rebaudengoi]|nr:hypothetical protein C8J57DRAFT_1482121 [Mycena rebaudengoi]
MATMYSRSTVLLFASVITTHDPSRNIPCCHAIVNGAQGVSLILVDLDAMVAVPAIPEIDKLNAVVDWKAISWEVPIVHCTPDIKTKESGPVWLRLSFGKAYRLCSFLESISTACAYASVQPMPLESICYDSPLLVYDMTSQTLPDSMYKLSQSTLLHSATVLDQNGLDQTIFPRCDRVMIKRDENLSVFLILMDPSAIVSLPRAPNAWVIPDAHKLGAKVDWKTLSWVAFISADTAITNIDRPLSLCLSFNRAAHLCGFLDSMFAACTTLSGQPVPLYSTCNLPQEFLQALQLAKPPRTSPITQMPVEILSLILLQLLPDTPAPIRRHPAIAISHTSRLFSRAALKTHKLWAEFTFTLAPSPFIQPFGPPNAKLLRLFLERASTSPLTLHTQLEKKNDPESLALFLASSRTWCHLDLRLENEGVPLLNSIRNHLPLLRTLQLHRQLSGSQSHRFDMFSNCPVLQCVDLRSFVDLDKIILPVQQLKKLTLTDFCGQWSLLPNLITAQALEFHQEHGRIFMSGSGSPSTYPLLHTLKLSSDIRVDSWDPELNEFIFPCLSTLVMQNTGHRLTHVASLIHRSQCNLDTLILDGMDFYDTSLLNLLHDILSLRRLSLLNLARLAITDKILNSLSGSPASQIYLPNLQHLRLEGSYHFRHHILCDLLHSRSPGGWHAVKLVSASIKLHNSEVGPIEVERLHKFVAEGMHISLYCLDDTDEPVMLI